MWGVTLNSGQLPVLSIIVRLALVSAETTDACTNLDTGGCVFEKHKCDDVFVNEVERLRPLFGKRYAYHETVDSQRRDYAVGICTSAEPTQFNPARYANVGVLQKNDDSIHYLGNITKAEIKSGRSWMELEYEGGESYGSHCANEPRRSFIMITCMPGETEGILTLTYENNQKKTDCFYQFELAVDAACDSHSSSGLSIGTIICIVFFCLLVVYLIGGLAYQRIIVGAKGMEQIPHYAFWQDFGNLQADGCDFIFRRGGSSTGSRQYRGIGDDQLQSHMEEPDTDEHLLPM